MQGTIPAVDLSTLHARLVGELRAMRGPDGGFSTSADGVSETESTAVASLALQDAAARRWLAARQRADGGFDELDGRSDGVATVALGALALVDAAAARHALGNAIAHRGLPLPDTDDPSLRSGWGWTDDARSTVEPTSRVLLAVNVLTPSDRATRDEAIRLLRERRCAGGGWNYGNASANDVDLRAYAQTTAIALIALQRGSPSLVYSGLRYLQESWRREPGGLTAAQALIAFRLHRVDDEARAAVEALDAISRRETFGQKPLTAAWAVLATGPETLLDSLRSRA